MAENEPLHVRSRFLHPAFEFNKLQLTQNQKTVLIDINENRSKMSLQKVGTKRTCENPQIGYYGTKKVDSKRRQPQPVHSLRFELSSVPTPFVSRY